MDVTTSTLQLSTPDGKMETFESRPKEGGAHPAVVVLMEAFGRNGHSKNVTERIAREGSVAIDTFGHVLDMAVEAECLHEDDDRRMRAAFFRPRLESFHLPVGRTELE